MRIDNGGEYISNNFKSYCLKKGIILEYTIPYTPQEKWQSGKNEQNTAK